MPVDEIRALTLFALVLTIVGLALVNLKFGGSVLTALPPPNPLLLRILPALAAILTLSLQWRFTACLFRFGPLHLDDLALTAGAGAMVFAWLDFLNDGAAAGRVDAVGPSGSPTYWRWKC